MYGVRHAVYCMVPKTIWHRFLYTRGNSKFPRIISVSAKLAKRQKKRRETPFKQRARHQATRKSCVHKQGLNVGRGRGDIINPVNPKLSCAMWEVLNSLIHLGSFVFFFLKMTLSNAKSISFQFFGGIYGTHKSVTCIHNLISLIKTI